MPGYNRRQLRRDILKEMILRECGCQDQEEVRASHGVQFHNNGAEEESGMIRSNLYTLSKQAQEMHDMIGMNDDLDEWVQEKIAVASSMIDSVYDYISYEYKSMRGEVEAHDSYNPDMLIDDTEDSEGADFDDEGADFDDYTIQEVAPPGGEDVVRALKGKKGIKSPYAVAWNMKNQGADLDEEELDDLDVEDVMHEPWKPLRQSTGIMFFEDEPVSPKRRR